MPRATGGDRFCPFSTARVCWLAVGPAIAIAAGDGPPGPLHCKGVPGRKCRPTRSIGRLLRLVFVRCRSSGTAAACCWPSPAECSEWPCLRSTHSTNTRSSWHHCPHEVSSPCTPRTACTAQPASLPISTYAQMPRPDRAHRARPRRKHPPTTNTTHIDCAPPSAET